MFKFLFWKSDYVKWRLFGLHFGGLFFFYVMMASSKIVLSIICLTLVFAKIGANIETTHDDVALKNQLDSLFESNNKEKIREFKTKDESIKWMDDNIREKSATIVLLLNDIQAVHVKGSLEAKEHLDKAQARINELETRVANLSKEIENLSQNRDALESLASITDKKNSELNSMLESLMKINDEQKTKICKIERALQVAEEEVIKAKLRETTFFRELIEVQESWFPHWLSVLFFHYQSSVSMQWKERGSLLLDPMLQKAVQKKAEFDKWAKPHIETVKTKWIPVTKKQSSSLITQIKTQVNLITTEISKVYYASTKSIQLHFGILQEIADPHFQKVKKLTKPYVHQVVTVAKPHVDSVNILLKPYTKIISYTYTQSLEALTWYHLQLPNSIREILKNDEVIEPLVIVLCLALPFMALRIFSRKNDRRNNKIERQNSHGSVAKQDGFLQRSDSGNYSGEITLKSKKRKMSPNVDYMIEGPALGTEKIDQQKSEYAFKRPPNATSPMPSRPNRTRPKKRSISSRANPSA